MTTVGVVAATDPAERRVVLTPPGVEKLMAAGHEVVVEAGAGLPAGLTDEAYAAAGARSGSRAEALAAEVILSVTGTAADHGDGSSDRLHIALFDPLWDPSQVAALAAAGAQVLALELVPRTTRAQSMDVLSSMATVAGYEAVLLAARRLPRMFPLMMTAAGTVQPAKVLVLGAGVAGLQAIATARRLGAVVSGYDVRPAAAEQIASLGAKVLEVPAVAGAEGEGGYAREQTDEENRRRREFLTGHVAAADVVVTTAAIPGRPSPLLVTTEMITGMSPGSVVVDLAAERGGNCEPTVADGEVDVAGVTVLGPTRLESDAAATASRMMSTNVTELLVHMTTDGVIAVDPDDEIVAEMLVASGGRVVHPRVLASMEEVSP